MPRSPAYPALGTSFIAPAIDPAAPFPFTAKLSPVTNTVMVITMMPMFVRQQAERNCTSYNSENGTLPMPGINRLNRRYRNTRDHCQCQNHMEVFFHFKPRILSVAECDQTFGFRLSFKSPRHPPDIAGKPAGCFALTLVSW